MKHALPISILICLLTIFTSVMGQGTSKTKKPPTGKSAPPKTAPAPAPKPAAPPVAAPTAPPFEPDTSLTYKDFLEQCVTFKKRENVNEVWAVQFWASWNSKSLSDMVRIKQLQTKYKNKPIRFVSVSVDKSTETWVTALQKTKITWEQMRVANETDYDFLKRAFKHNSIPALFLVDKKGGVHRMETTTDLSKELAEEAKKLPDGVYTKPIILPPPPPPAPPPVIEKPKGPDYTGWVIHKVEEGETLYSIAKRYNISITEVQTNNELGSNTIKLGQILKIRQEL
jgi:thiol-disulfide isomerase/thioredoxin